MGNRYIYPASSPKFVRRNKTMRLADGTERRATLTPYTYGEFLKPCAGPRGGKAYKTCYRAVWECDGILYALSKGRTEQGEWVRFLVPLTAAVWDRYGTGLPTAQFENGIAV